MYFFSIIISFCLWQLSFGSEYSDATPFDSEHSEISSSMLRKRLNVPYYEVKPLLSDDSMIYINAVLSDVNSTISYDHETHFRDIFENLTDEKKLIKLSNFFFKLCEYLEMTYYEQFRKKNHPNSCLSDFRKRSRTDPDFLSIKEHSNRAHISLVVVNFALLKQRLGPTKLTKELIFKLITQLEMRASLEGQMIDFANVILQGVIEESGKLGELEKEAFISFLSFQKDFVKQSLDCIKEAFKPTSSELIGCPFIVISHLIDGIIDSYQLNK